MTRFLLVNDDLHIAEFFSEVACAHGFAADVVHDGVPACGRVMYLEYDGVLTNLAMRTMDGAALLKAVRAYTTRRTPTVLESGYASGLEETAADAGAEWSLALPVQLVDVVRTFRDMRQRRIELLRLQLHRSGLIEGTASATAAVALLLRGGSMAPLILEDGAARKRLRAPSPRAALETLRRIGVMPLDPRQLKRPSQESSTPTKPRTPSFALIDEQLRLEAEQQDEVTRDLYLLALCLAQSEWSWVIAPDLELVVDPPSECHFGEKGRPHREIGPAIRFDDGFSVHAQDGVLLPMQPIHVPRPVPGDRSPEDDGPESRTVGGPITTKQDDSGSPVSDPPVAPMSRGARATASIGKLLAPFRLSGTINETIENLLSRIDALAAPPLALEACWDGDTNGWFVALSAIHEGPSYNHARYTCHGLAVYTWSRAKELFDGDSPFHPEGLLASAIGRSLAEELDVPFHFESPEDPIGAEPTRWWDAQEPPEPTPWEIAWSLRQTRRDGTQVEDAGTVHETAPTAREANQQVIDRLMAPFTFDAPVWPDLLEVELTSEALGLPEGPVGITTRVGMGNPEPPAPASPAGPADVGVAVLDPETGRFLGYRYEPVEHDEDVLCINPHMCPDCVVHSAAPDDPGGGPSAWVEWCEAHRPK